MLAFAYSVLQPAPLQIAELTVINAELSSSQTIKVHASIDSSYILRVQYIITIGALN